MAGTTSPSTSGFVTGVQAYLPTIQWLLTIIVAVSVFVLSFRDGQTSQAAMIQGLRSDVETIKARQLEVKVARDKQIDDLREQMVTKTNLQDKFDTLLKIQELTREDLKNLRDDIKATRIRGSP